MQLIYFLFSDISASTWTEFSHPKDGGSNLLQKVETKSLHYVVKNPQQYRLFSMLYYHVTCTFGPYFATMSPLPRVPAILSLPIMGNCKELCWGVLHWHSAGIMLWRWVGLLKKVKRAYTHTHTHTYIHTHTHTHTQSMTWGAYFRHEVGKEATIYGISYCQQHVPFLSSQMTVHLYSSILTSVLALNYAFYLSTQGCSFYEFALFVYTHTRTQYIYIAYYWMHC